MARASDPELARSAAAAVVSRLRAAGHVAYFAGGCVRDELLGLHPTDYDVATDAPPQRVRELFTRTAEVGAAFGVVLVNDNDASIEVATFRADGPYSDARRPDVVRFSDPLTDARRRDFTINALFLDPLAAPEPALPHVRGRVIDLVGGLPDIQARILRAVGDPDLRLAEDHLRALRAVRFCARFGFHLEPGTGAAIQRHASELRGVSRERIGEELRRMFAHPSRADAVALLESLGLDQPVLDEPHVESAVAALKSVANHHPYGALLAAWYLDRGGLYRNEAYLRAAVARWRKSLCLSNEEREAMLGTLLCYRSLASDWTGATEAGQKRLAGFRWFAGAMDLLAGLQPASAATVAARVAELERTKPGISPEPLITGEDLIRAGLDPGPRFRALLDLVFDAQLEGKVRTKAEAMELVRRSSV